MAGEKTGVEFQVQKDLVTMLGYAAEKYKLGDNSPMLYMTEDYGDNWRMINGNLPANDFTRCIREDPDRPKMIYAGTETKVYVSFDDGNSWSNLGGEDLIGKNSLPIVPIYDIVIKNDDLIVVVIEKLTIYAKI